MVEPWLVYFLIFASVFLGAQLLQVALRGAFRGERHSRRRFTALGRSGPTAAEPDVLRKQARSSFGDLALLAWLDSLRRQSGTQLGLPGAGLVVLLVTLATGLALPMPESLLARCLLGAASGILILIAYLRAKRARRVARFAEQLPEAIDIFVRSLRVGHPLPVSLALVAREMPPPLGPEFAIVVDEVNYGRSIGEALEGLNERVGYPELRFLVASIAIGQQTGGNLGEILSRLSKMLRERFRLRRRVRALSAEGRFSGYALSALPIVLFGLVNLVSRSYYADFWASPSADTVLAVSLGLLLVGNVMIYRMVNFKV